MKAEKVEKWERVDKWSVCCRECPEWRMTTEVRVCMELIVSSYPGNPATSRINLDSSARSSGNGDLQ